MPASFPVLIEDGSYSTVAFSVARLTLAARTPSVPESAFSTRRAHAAHVIPVTDKEIFPRSSLMPRPPFASSNRLLYPPTLYKGKRRRGGVPLLTAGWCGHRWASCSSE